MLITTFLQCDLNVTGSLIRQVPRVRSLSPAKHLASFELDFLWFKWNALTGYTLFSSFLVHIVIPENYLKVLFSVNAKQNYFLKTFFSKILIFFYLWNKLELVNVPRIAPKKLCKIWVGSVIRLRTIPTLNRGGVSKTRIFSLSQQSRVFI